MGHTRKARVGPGGALLTASIGVATLAEVAPAAAPATLAALADARLYAAKARRDAIVAEAAPFILPQVGAGPRQCAGPGRAAHA